MHANLYALLETHMTSRENLYAPFPRGMYKSYLIYALSNNIYAPPIRPYMPYSLIKFMPHSVINFCPILIYVPHSRGIYIPQLMYVHQEYMPLY
jgi:hypothetical protein